MCAQACARARALSRVLYICLSSLCLFKTACASLPLAGLTFLHLETQDLRITQRLLRVCVRASCVPALLLCALAYGSCHLAFCKAVPVHRASCGLHSGPVFETQDLALCLPACACLPPACLSAFLSACLPLLRSSQEFLPVNHNTAHVRPTMHATCWAC